MQDFLAKAEIAADGTEDALLQLLAAAMKARGFTLPGVIAVREMDGALTTFGQPCTTESAEFSEILRRLADEIEMVGDKSADQIIPSA